MASQQSRLLSLLREMRDQIYHEYIFIDAEYGYIFDFAAGKLRAANTLPVHELGNASAQGQASALALDASPTLANANPPPSRSTSI